MSTNYNVVYAADNNFASVLGTSIYSLFDNNRDAEKINVFILDGGINESNKRKIINIENQYRNSNIVWIKVESISSNLGIDVHNDRGSLSQYSRLFIGSLVNKNVNRILYLDCDTLIVSSINKLWNLDLKGNTISALKDAFSKYYRKNIGLSNNDIMFNSGVMLIDLEAWRNQNIEKKALSFILKKNGKIQQGDQGVLNSILSKKTLPLDPKYNLVSIFYELTFNEIRLYRAPYNFYDEKAIKDAKKKPVIIHYTSSFYSIRPWFVESNHPITNVWLSYYRRTPWKNTDLNHELNKSKKIIIKLFNLNMKKPLLLCAGIFQKYLRPLKNRFGCSK